MLILPLNAIQSYHKLLCFVGAAYAIWIILEILYPHYIQYEGQI